MKINIKGFTFVGFAAAIFAVNAMAAVEPSSINTVTSKSYVDAKIVDNVTGTAQDKAPSQLAVKNALANKQDNLGGENKGGKLVTATENAGTVSYTELVKQNNDSGSKLNDQSTDTTIPTSKTVYTAIQALAGTAADSYQPKTLDTTPQVALSSDGVDPDWTSLVEGTYASVTVNNDGDVVIDAKATTDTTLASANETGKLPTAATVKTYVDNAIDAMGDNVDGDDAYISATYDSDTNVTTISLMSTSVDNAGQVVSDLTSTTGTKLVTDFTLQENMATKQDLQTDSTHYQVSKDGTWGNITSAVSGSTYVATAADTTTGGVAVSLQNLSTQGTDVNSSDDGLTTGQAVYEYVNSVTGGNQIPQKNPAVCDSSTYNNAPCALVAEADGLHWRTVATALHSGGVLGDLTSGS